MSRRLLIHRFAVGVALFITLALGAAALGYWIGTIT